ncbi:MAG: ABC transporter permease [Chloroflexota bacterium]
MLSGPIRGWTLLTRELLDVARQPFLILALVLGPFLILLVFAIGHRGTRPPLRAVLVVPTTMALPRDVSFWRDRFGDSVAVVAVTADESSARATLTNQQSDLVLVIPSDAATSIKNGHQAVIQVLHDQSDPVEQAYIGYVAYILAAELNKQVIADTARRVQRDVQSARPALSDLRQTVDAMPDTPDGRVRRLKNDLSQVDSLSTQLDAIAPGLLAAPFQSTVENVAPIAPTFVAYYSPGVLALLLQHLAITFMALSLVRDRMLGMIELYQAAPTSVFGLLLGKHLSYGALCLGIGGALTLLMTRYLAVPFLGDPRLYWGTLALLVFASLGIGLTISLLSTSQESAVQLTMLVLLASVFFSGFFLPIGDFQAPATQVSFVLPVSHATVALQDLMLRGQLVDPAPLAILAGIGALLLLVNVQLMRRELRRS